MNNALGENNVTEAGSADSTQVVIGKMIVKILYRNRRGLRVTARVLADLALGMEIGEIVPLGSKLFSRAAGASSPASDSDAGQDSAIDVAELLRCDPDASVLPRVAMPALRQAENPVAERLRHAAHAAAAPLKNPQNDPMRVHVALIAAMDAAEAALTESVTT